VLLIKFRPNTTYTMKFNEVGPFSQMRLTQDGEQKQYPHYTYAVLLQADLAKKELLRMQAGKHYLDGLSTPNPNCYKLLNL